MKGSYVYMIICAALIITLGGCRVRNERIIAESETTDTPISSEIFAPSSSKEERAESVSTSTENSHSESVSYKEELTNNNSSSDTSSKIYYASKVINSEASENTAATVSEQTPSETVVTYKYHEEEQQETAEIEPTLDISLNSTSISIGETLYPVVMYGEEELSKNDFLLYSWDNSIIEINDGCVYAVSEGICTLSAEYEGKTANISITVFDSENPDPDLNFYADGILIVNKKYYINAQSDPGGLSDECVEAFEHLVQDAAADGISIYALSDYRSYAEQEEIYNSYVAMYGYDGANALCALPGHSEHQTGLAIDCATLDSGYFPGTPAAAWLDVHCADYGFIIRYPYGKDAYTGYSYEPWHIRYIGNAAQDIQNSGLSLEEYFGLTQY